VSDTAFNAKVQRVVDQANIVREVINRSDRDDVQVDFKALTEALGVASQLPTGVDAKDIRKAIKSIHQELLDAHAANLGADGDPDLLQLDQALEILITRLTAVADSGDADWAELGPDTRGQVVDTVNYADDIAKIHRDQAEIITQLGEIGEKLETLTENKLNFSIAVPGGNYPPPCGAGEIVIPDWDESC
jgi:hypothetical protein